MRDGPSDRLRDVYEQRAVLEYAAPAPQVVDPLLERKFHRMWDLVTAQLPCEAFLDAGCGDGRYLAAFAGVPARPRRIAGADISERILETARQTARRAGGTTELARVLAPGGRLVFSTDNSRNYVTKALNLPRTAAVRGLRLTGRRKRVEFPHRAFTPHQVSVPPGSTSCTSRRFAFTSTRPSTGRPCDVRWRASTSACRPTAWAT